MASSLENLRDWIDQSPHLKNIRQDDQVFHPTFYNHALSCRTSHVMKHSRSWSSFYVVASLALRGPRRSWTTSTWSKEPCLSGLTGVENYIVICLAIAQIYPHPAKRWDPSEPGVAELLKQGVYLPLPGYDDQVWATTKSILGTESRDYSLLYHYWQYKIVQFRDVLLSFALLAG